MAGFAMVSGHAVSYGTGNLCRIDCLGNHLSRDILENEGRSLAKDRILSLESYYKISAKLSQEGKYESNESNGFEQRRR